MKNPTQKAILSIMGPEPMSALDIANQINFPREKIYYHLKKLEKANKIFVSETEIINGITKKKYLKVTSQLTQGASERGVSEKDTVQEQNIINEITVLDQEDEDLGEDRGSAASVEDEIADEPVQEIPDITVLDKEDEPADEPVQEIPDMTVLDQEDEDIGEDLGSVDSVENEIADEPVQEIPDMTVLNQENEALDEDLGSAASVEDETVDEPVQEIPETTVLNQEDEEFVQKEIGNNTLVQNLMKAKGVVPDTENEAQSSQPTDPSSPPETDIGRTIEKRRMSDDRRTTGERRKESERRVEEKKESVGDEKRSGQERRKGKEKRVSADRRKAIDRKQKAEKKKAKKPVLQSNWLYLYRLLSGYSKTVTFVQKGNRVNFLHATIKRKGFQVHKKQTYMLPLAVNEDTTIHTLPQLIHHVFTEKFKLGERKKYYVAVYSSEYKFEIDFLKIPILKKNELYDYMLMKLGKMFSVDPNNLIIDWTINDVQDKKDTTQDAICLISDKTPILNDVQYLLEQNIQLRYTTSIAKIQYDQFLFNHGPDSDGNALLLYIGKSFTRITLVNDWKLVESRKSSIGLDSFLDLYLKLNESNENIDYESARKYMLTQPFIGDDNTPLKTVYEKLISEIELSLSHFRKKNLLISNNVLVSGIVSTIPQIVDQMKTSLGMDITPLNVQKSLEKKQREGLEEYYDNIGLLLDPKDQLNLLPYRHRQNFKFFFPTKLMKIILAGMLVLFVSAMSVQYNTLISIKGPIAEKKNQVKSALIKQDTFFKFFAEAEALKALARAQEQDKFWAEKTAYLLKMFSKTLPENVKINSLEFTGADEYILSTVLYSQDAVLNGEIMYKGSNPNLELNNLINALKEDKYIKDVQLLSSKNKTKSLFTFEMILRL